MSSDRQVLWVRRATLLDLDQLWGLRTEAAAWLAGEGVEQWSGANWDANWWEKSTLSVLARRTWVVQDDPKGGEIAAAIAFGAPDLDFWEPDEDRWFARDAHAPVVTPGGPAAAALYFYRFAVSGRFRGLRLGEAVLDWAARWATMEERAFLRCDCNRANTGLHRYYERCGFRHVRTVEVGHRASGALFERPATLLTYEGPIRIELLDDPAPLRAAQQAEVLESVERRVEHLRATVEA
jgi:GNAT superfamily N-acetyltransferase